MERLISVVVCTHGRADLLAGALHSLCEQTLDPACYEVIVVDNNSADNTRVVAEDFCSRYPQVRYYLEAQLGLSYARNRGLHEARGEYVGYMDDDCKAPLDWLLVAREVIDRMAPAAFGGPIFAFYNSPKPCWFKDEYGTHDLGTEALALDSAEYVYGGNLFLRRAVLLALGGFDPALGMAGPRIGYGEETALLLRMRANMPAEIIYYEPRLYVHHLVAARKMTWRWILRSSWADGRDSGRVFGGQAERSEYFSSHFRFLLAVTARSIDLGGAFVHGALLRDREMYPYLQNYVYERLIPRLAAISALRGIIRSW